MRTLYLRCEENETEGEFASSVFIHASLTKPRQTSPRVIRRLAHPISSEKMPMEVLGELEAAVFREIRERPSAKDIFQGADGVGRFRNYSRHIGYHSTNSPFPVTDRNAKIFEVYRRYIQSF